MNVGDLIYVKAWWLKNDVCQVEVKKVYPMLGIDDYADVKPVTGNPHQRTIKLSRDYLPDYPVTKVENDS